MLAPQWLGALSAAEQKISRQQRHRSVQNRAWACYTYVTTGLTTWRIGSMQNLPYQSSACCTTARLRDAKEKQAPLLHQANGPKQRVPSETVCHDRWRLPGRTAAAPCAVQALAGRCAPAEPGLVVCFACDPEVEAHASEKGTFV